MLYLAYINIENIYNIVDWKQECILLSSFKCLHTINGSIEIIKIKKYILYTSTNMVRIKHI